MVKRVVVIGAGPSGMSTVRALKLAGDQDLPGGKDVEVICYEKQPTWGGMWNFTWRTGLDESGEPVHNSMYHHLWINAPKENLEFYDYPYDKHFGQPVPSYVPRVIMWDYLTSRMAEAGIHHLFRFNHPVQYVTFDESTKQFHVTVRDTKNDRVFTDTCDYVVVASSHFSYPNVPDFPGFDTFPGRIIHSHDFRESQVFKGRNVLTIGNGYSAEDIASLTWKFGAKSVIVSYHSKAFGHKWPEGIEERPTLARMEGTKAIFKDGSVKEDVDDIILCSGYLHNFPFLEPSLRLKTKNRFWPDGLYKSIVFEGNHQLFYMGMQNKVYAYPLFDCMAYYIRDLVLGRASIPHEEERKAHFAKWRAQEEQCANLHDFNKLQSDYMRELMVETDYPKRSCLEGQVENVHGWLRSKEEGGIMNFRDNAFRSAVTGTMAATHDVKWVDTRDDSSMVKYMRDCAGRPALHSCCAYLMRILTCGECCGKHDRKVFDSEMAFEKHSGKDHVPCVKRDCHDHHHDHNSIVQNGVHHNGH
ncbi:flavin-binding monooxygenase-like domain-containing protein [Ditylenchus destructor]|uniref:Flavin-containing monooxygenase n=1 Tax=Ditylenchus destructor TaxID=166010 RepID=A0AAD4ML72_9BILA|nr:flavin-binding monooxygenase-like domain-containing protein [Ditylenchus destructor]